jgi:DNA-binding MarR family transcriptional regulator
MSVKPTKKQLIDFNNLQLADLKTYQVGAIQASAHRALRKHGDELLSHYNLSSMQWHVIGAIIDAGGDGARISELAELLDTTMGFLTNNVNVLVSKGMVYRSTNIHDGRSHFLHISEEFAPIAQEIEESLRASLRKSIYSKITRSELTTYLKVIGKFAELS